MYRPVVTICTAQWSLYVPPSGHYMYRTAVTIYTAQWSLYVPPNGHYKYRTMVTVYTAQRSLYVRPNGHYMYRLVVTICTAQLPLYVPPNGHHYRYIGLLDIFSKSWWCSLVPLFLQNNTQSSCSHLQVHSARHALLWSSSDKPHAEFRDGIYVQ